MGIIFQCEFGEILMESSDGYSLMFVHFTKLVAESYGLPMPLGPIQPDMCHVDGDNFCALVEAAFAEPNEHFYGWIQEATGIYEVFRGEKVTWQWPHRETPSVPFFPQRSCGSCELPYTGRLLGLDLWGTPEKLADFSKRFGNEFRDA